MCIDEDNANPIFTFILSACWITGIVIKFKTHKMNQGWFFVSLLILTIIGCIYYSLWNNAIIDSIGNPLITTILTMGFSFGLIIKFVRGRYGHGSGFVVALLLTWTGGVLFFMWMDGYFDSVSSESSDDSVYTSSRSYAINDYEDDDDYKEYEELEEKHNFEIEEYNKSEAVSSGSKTYEDRYGYYRFTNSQRLVHHWVVEKTLGRKLRKNEVVHHKNWRKKDNRPENLAVMDKDNHSRLHSGLGYDLDDFSHIDLADYA